MPPPPSRPLGQCTDPQCAKEPPTCVFDCAYHCDGRLCLAHLNEHQQLYKQEMNELERLQKEVEETLEVCKTDETRLKAIFSRYLDANRRFLEHASVELQQVSTCSSSISSSLDHLRPLLFSASIRKNQNQFLFDTLSVKVEDDDTSVLAQTPSNEILEICPSAQSTRSNEDFVNSGADGEQFSQYNSVDDLCLSSDGSEILLMPSQEPQATSRSSAQPRRKAEFQSFLLDSAMSPADLTDDTTEEPMTNSEEGDVITTTTTAAKEEDSNWPMPRLNNLYAPCPITMPSAFGIDTQAINLCSPGRGPCNLYAHLKKAHRLRPFAATRVVQAVARRQNPATTKLFYNHERATDVRNTKICCPFTTNKNLFMCKPDLIHNAPCQSCQRADHLKMHLVRAHHITKMSADKIMYSLRRSGDLSLVHFAPHEDLTDDSVLFNMYHRNQNSIELELPAE